MRRLLLPFLLGFLILWLFGGAWWYAQQQPQPILQKNQPTENSPIAPSFTFKDETFTLEVEEDISFLQSSYDAYIPEPVNNALFELTQYFNKQEDKLLLITGKYEANELNNSEYKNLGIARAEALKSRLIRLGFEGDRLITRGIKVQELDFQEGLVYEVVSLSTGSKEEHQ